MKLENKIAIITGGASGLGKSITELLLKNGTKVAVLDFDKEALEDLEDNENILKIFCDITKDDEIQNALNRIKNRFKIIDILVNNAGILHSEPLINITSKHKRHSIESWKKTIDINLTAAFVMGSYVAEQMVENRIKGIIINISSISAKGNIGQSAYSASKAGLESMTKVWAKELGSFGIRCVAIAPGFIDIKSTHKALSEDKLNNIKKQTPLRMLGDVKDIAEIIKFSLENDFINGKTLRIDGGFSI